MSSGFVSGGTIDEPVERDEEWRKVNKDLEEERRREAEAKAAGQQNAGKSLYEILQENKAAKQEAFQESIRLKNQFRTLDEDEIEFLDTVLESTRAQEAAVTKETMEQLEIFNRQREEAAKAEAAKNATSNDLITPEEQDWKTLHRKRRRKEKEPLVGAKLRKRSIEQRSPSKDDREQTTKAKATRQPSGAGNIGSSQAEAKSQSDDGDSVKQTPCPTSNPTAAPATAVLGLDAYSSDED